VTDITALYQGLPSDTDDIHISTLTVAQTLAFALSTYVTLYCAPFGTDVFRALARHPDQMADCLVYRAKILMQRYPRHCCAC
jgi:hypothetical protein